LTVYIELSIFLILTLNKLERHWTNIQVFFISQIRNPFSRLCLLLRVSSSVWPCSRMWLQCSFVAMSSA